MCKLVEASPLLIQKANAVRSESAERNSVSFLPSSGTEELAEEICSQSPVSFCYHGRRLLPLWHIIPYVSVVAQLLSHVWLFATPWTPGLLVHDQILEFTQTHVHRVSDAIQPSHPLLSPSLPILNLSQHQGLFRWVGSSNQVAKLLEFQHQSFQWIFRIDFL